MSDAPATLAAEPGLRAAESGSALAYLRAALRLSWVLGSCIRLAGVLLAGGEPRRALHRWALRAIPGLGVEAALDGALSAEAGLWVANHMSWLDPLVLMQFRPMGALAKGEVAAYPLIGSLARRLDLAFVDRSDAISRAASVARLAREYRLGRPILVFPEGTTTTGSSLAQLQEGGLRAAYRCGIRTQVIRLSSPDADYPWIGDDALLPHLGRILRNRRTPVRIRAGAVLDPAGFPSEDAWIAAIRRHLHPIS